MGSITPDLFEGMGVTVSRPIDAADIGSAFLAAARQAVESERPVAVVIGQGIMGAKKFEAGAPAGGATD